MEGNHEDSDRLLRDAVLAGNERAWETWYEQSYDDLYRYVRWRCGGLPDRTSEVVQETWLTAVRRVRRFDPDQGTFGGWLRGIAANVLRSEFRRNEKARRRRQSLSGDLEAADSNHEELQRQERAERVMAALVEMPDRYEEALRAKYLDGLSVAQIADTWSETPKAVESLLTRARQKFRETYDRNGDLESTGK